MQLKLDSLRDVLLALEELLTVEDVDVALYQKRSIDTSALFAKLPEYDRTEIKYVVEELKEAGYIKCAIASAGKQGSFILYIDGITVDGARLLERILPEDAWAKVKGVLREGARITISSIAQAAAEVFLSSNGA